MENKKSRYFVKCDCCGKKIYMGDPIYHWNGYCGTYCSPECFASEYATEDELSFDHADNCACEIYKEDDNSEEVKLTSLDAGVNNGKVILQK